MVVFCPSPLYTGHHTGLGQMSQVGRLVDLLILNETLGRQFTIWGYQDLEFRKILRKQKVVEAYWPLILIVLETTPLRASPDNKRTRSASRKADCKTRIRFASGT